MSKDRLTKADLEKLLALLPCQYSYVETGVADGDQLVIANEVFRRVLGIELSEHYCKVASEISGCLVVQGKSEEMLPRLYFPGPTVFYLDAHYCQLDPPIEKSHFPLWEELNFIASRDNKHDIIIVDDVHTFGKVRPELKYDDETQEWANVTENSLICWMNHNRDQDELWTGEVIKDCFVMRRTDA